MKKEEKLVSSKIQDEEFVRKLIGFYEESIKGLVEPVRRLSEIQKAYPKQYASFKRMSRNPEAIVVLLAQIGPEEKAAFFEVFVRAASLSERTRILTELTSKEQEILANDLVKFGNEIPTKFLPRVISR